jgi:Tfp pilus assembly protein FimT
LLNSTDQQRMIASMRPTKFEEYVMCKSLNIRKSEFGFSMLEVMVILGIISIMAAIAVPSFSRWLPGNRLKSAARDLYSNLQLTKIGAVRTGSTWAIVFDPGSPPGRYYICSDPGANGIWEGPAGDDTVDKIVDLANYKSGLDYGHGNATTPIETTFDDEITFGGNVVVFSARGTCNSGYVYFDNSKNNTSYGVGTRTVGSINLKKWSGGSWQ